jgi:hypothetical protein
LRIDGLQFGHANYTVLFMTFIAWEQKYNTGIKEIDTQHKRLVDIINELYDARHSQSSQAVLNVILSRLIDYAEYHFDFEEAIAVRLSIDQRQLPRINSGSSFWRRRVVPQ